MSDLEKMMKQWGCTTAEELYAKHRAVNAEAGREYFAKLHADNIARVAELTEKRRIAKNAHYVVIGANGNMGRRYTEWLKWAQCLVVGIDVNASEQEWTRYLEHALGVVVATPTDSHMETLAKIRALRADIPILCEKPLAKDVDVATQFDLNIQMVDQYAHVKRTPDPEKAGWTIYESHYSGKDGLEWDCINILAKASDFAKTRLTVAEGQEWRCWINGDRIERADLEAAYFSMVKAWVAAPAPNLDYIRHAHNQVRAYIEFQASSQA